DWPRRHCAGLEPAKPSKLNIGCRPLTTQPLPSYIETQDSHKRTENGEEMPTPTPDAKRGTVDLAILATLEHHARYGLEILDEVQRATDGALTFKEGSLYPALHRLVKQGWVESRWEESDTGGAPRKYYDLTDDGRKALVRKRQEWQIGRASCR